MKRKCIVIFMIGMLLLMISACGSRNDSQTQNTESKNQSQDGTNDTAKVEEISENSTEEADDTELIAVISAAIAAAEGTDTDGFIVRSIRRRPANKWSSK